MAPLIYDYFRLSLVGGSDESDPDLIGRFESRRAEGEFYDRVFFQDRRIASTSRHRSALLNSSLDKYSAKMGFK